MPNPVHAEAIRLFWTRSRGEIQRRAKETEPGEGPGGGLTAAQNAAAQKIKYQMFRDMPAGLKEALLKEARESLGISEPREGGEAVSSHEAAALPLLRGRALAPLPPSPPCIPRSWVQYCFHPPDPPL